MNDCYPNTESKKKLRIGNIVSFFTHLLYVCIKKTVSRREVKKNNMSGFLPCAQLFVGRDVVFAVEGGGRGTSCSQLTESLRLASSSCAHVALSRPPKGYDMPL